MYDIANHTKFVPPQLFKTKFGPCMQHCLYTTDERASTLQKYHYTATTYVPVPQTIKYTLNNSYIGLSIGKFNTKRPGARSASRMNVVLMIYSTLVTTRRTDMQPSFEAWICNYPPLLELSFPMACNASFIPATDDSLPCLGILHFLTFVAVGDKGAGGRPPFHL